MRKISGVCFVSKVEYWCYMCSQLQCGGPVFCSFLINIVGAIGDHMLELYISIGLYVMRTVFVFALLNQEEDF